MNAQVALEPGTATPGADLDAETGPIELTAGQTTVDVNVRAIGDSLLEDTEEATLVVTDRDDNVLGRAVVIVIDDDVH
jgi:hypothetical protein